MRASIDLTVEPRKCKLQTPVLCILRRNVKKEQLKIIDIYDELIEKRDEWWELLKLEEKKMEKAVEKGKKKAQVRIHTNIHMCRDALTDILHDLDDIAIAAGMSMRKLTYIQAALKHRKLLDTIIE